MQPAHALSEETLPDIEAVTSSMANKLSVFDADFCRRMYEDDFPKYARRLQAIGMQKHEHVLDAGCGFGQWTLSLAGLNTNVSACDISAARVEFVNAYSKACGYEVDCRKAGIDALPFDDASFDAVFCYGVIFLTPWKQSLKELTRVLKPGGKLYVNANGLGWFLFLWKSEHNKIGDYDPRKEAAESFSNTITYERDGIMKPGSQLIIEPNEFEAALKAHGYDNITVGAEGTLHLCADAPAPVPNFKGEYEGQSGVYEIVCTKAG